MCSGNKTHILKQQQYAAVWPRLEIRHTWNNVNHIYKLNLENTGIGPAIIREVNIHYNNKIFQDFGDMAIEVSRSNKLEDEGSYWDKSDVLPQAVLPQQREKQLLFIGDEKYFETFVEELDSIEVKITYESLYGEAWEITYPKIRHRRID
ncbi:hypothetical protein [Flagellimonas crocea]|uniref:hypothetical protein n=1 Tax=Flagellimonas crocea TaxID=3067311 RepID=UPI00296F36B0|nr:hypothetical protein [Muricauda sp. DH64]